MQAKEGSQGGVAFFVALYSLLREKSTLAGLVVLGEMTIQGNIMPVRSLLEPLQVILDNGAKKVLVPVSNKRQYLEVPGDLMERAILYFTQSHWPLHSKRLGCRKNTNHLAAIRLLGRCVQPQNHSLCRCVGKYFSKLPTQLFPIPTAPPSRHLY